MSNQPDLLPAPGEIVRCAPHAERHSIDPGGTAVWVDEIVVVEVPLPWPKPVWAHEGFTAVPEWVLDADAAGRRVRVLAAVPDPDADAGEVVVHHRAGGATFTRIAHHARGSSVVELLESVLREAPVEPVRVATPVDDSVRELLICTQGSHDICCGSRGPALVAELEAARPDVAVRRVSHTGGHRFAPTGLSLPDGRMWGSLDLEMVLAILDRDAPPSSVTDRCRGWTGVTDGPAQVAERAVFAAVDDWTFDDRRRHVGLVAESEEQTRWVVEADDHRWHVEIARGREVPTIACGQPGGLPAKPGSEWDVRAVHEA